MQKHKRHSGGMLNTAILKPQMQSFSYRFPLSYKSGDATAHRIYMYLSGQKVTFFTVFCLKILFFLQRVEI